MQEIRRVAEEDSVDILCLQEPYTKEGKILNLPSTAQVVATGVPAKAAIVVLNRAYRVISVPHLCDTHTQLVEVLTQQGSFFIINAYFQYADRIEPYMNWFREAVGFTRGAKLICTMDANARSRLWHSVIVPGEARRAVRRGEQLVEMFQELQLEILNRPGFPPTYEGRRGASSNIDVTLQSAHEGLRAADWKVSRKVHSDHNLITFTVAIQGETPEDDDHDEGLVRYTWRKANWERLRQVLVVPDWPEGANDVDRAAENLTQALLTAVDTAVPRAYPSKVPQTPWSPELDRLRRESRRARRAYQRSIGDDLRRAMLARYRDAKATFKRTLNEVRIESWKTFVREKLAVDPWGLPYKIAAAKVRAPTVLSALKRADGSHTGNWRETADFLLDTLLPDDISSEDESESQVELRQKLDEEYANETPVAPFTEREVTDAILGLRRRKATGQDGIAAECLQATRMQIGPYLTKLFNECLVQGRVPRCWKTAEVVILYKGDGKDPGAPKSYRPICLLNCLAKLQEKLLCLRLEEYRALRGRSPNQFGFRRGLCTEDAINKAMSIVDASESKYVLGIMIDIAGAFDNLWWPALFGTLRELECPGQLYRSLRDYCRNRQAVLRCPGQVVEKSITKGCPQGSVCGPVFWDIGLDPVLNELDALNQVFGVVAYADDILIVIEGRSRAMLEANGNAALAALENWCDRVKLRLSPEKTTFMFLKGVLHRDPMLRVNGGLIRRKPVTRYLGVHLDESRLFSKHIEEICRKGLILFNKLASIANKTYHLRLETIRLYHQSLLVTIMAYGASSWAHRLRKIKPALAIRRVQRSVLIRLTGAYSTSSGDALQVITGIPPLDLLIRERGALYWLRKNDMDHVTNILGRPADSPAAVREWLYDEWQQRWDELQTGRRVHRFLPNVRERMRYKFLRPTRGMVHFLTGHGPYAQYLQKIGANENRACGCGEEGTPEHVLWDCPLYANTRTGELPPHRDVGRLLRSRAHWRLLDNLASAVSAEAHDEHIRRQGIERLQGRGRNPNDPDTSEETSAEESEDESSWAGD